MSDVARRSFLAGLGAALVTAPAVVRSASLMPVRGLVRMLCLLPVGIAFSRWK